MDRLVLILCAVAFCPLKLSAYSCETCFFYRSAQFQPVPTVLLEYFEGGVAMVWNREIKAVSVHEYIDRIPCTREQEKKMHDDDFADEDLSFQRWRESSQELTSVLYDGDTKHRSFPPYIPKRVEVLFYDVQGGHALPGFIKLIFGVSPPRCFIVRVADSV